MIELWEWAVVLLVVTVKAIKWLGERS